MYRFLALVAAASLAGPLGAEEGGGGHFTQEAPAPVQEKAGYSPAERTAAQWAFLKGLAEDPREEVAQEVLKEVSRLLWLEGEREFSEEAQSLKSALHARLGDHRAAVVDLLKLLYVYPGSKLEFQAKRSLLDIADKKLDKKLKPALSELARGAESPHKSARLAALLKRLSEQAGQALYAPTLAEYDDFFSHYPEYERSDEMLFSLGQLHAKNEKYATAILVYQKLLALYPHSALCPQTLAAVGDVWAGELREYNKAIDVYHEVTNRYPDSEQAALAYEQIARLEEQLRQYDLALEVYDKVVAKYPGSLGAQKALSGKARLLRETLGRPEAALEAYGQLADMFKGTPAALEALRLAAQTARKAKNYEPEFKLQQRVFSEYPDSPEAAEALFSCAELQEQYLSDPAKAEEYFSKFLETYPNHKLASKARGRLEALRKKSG